MRKKYTFPVVKNKYTKMYLKYIYFMRNTTNTFAYKLLNRNNQQFHVYYTKLAYLMFAKMKQLIKYLCTLIVG